MADNFKKIIQDLLPCGRFHQRSQIHIFQHSYDISGDYGGEDTPLPIPNREVKLISADGTAWVTLWESRSSPGLIKKALAAMQALFFVTRQKMDGKYGKNGRHGKDEEQEEGKTEEIGQTGRIG